MHFWAWLMNVDGSKRTPNTGRHLLGSTNRFVWSFLKNQMLRQIVFPLSLPLTRKMAGVGKFLIVESFQRSVGSGEINCAMPPKWFFHLLLSTIVKFHEFWQTFFMDLPTIGSWEKNIELGADSQFFSPLWTHDWKLCEGYRFPRRLFFSLSGKRSGSRLTHFQG